MRRQILAAGGLLAILSIVVMVQIFSPVTYGGGWIAFLPPNKELNYLAGDFSIGASFGGSIPSYYVNAPNPKVSYFLNLQNIIQYNDLNNNYQMDEGETVGNLTTLSLEDVDWDYHYYHTLHSSDVIDFSLGSTTINNSFFTGVSLNVTNYYIPGFSRIEFDFNITNWPFTTQATDLLIEFQLEWDPEAQLSAKREGKRINLEKPNGKETAFISLEADISLDNEPSQNGGILSEPFAFNTSKISFHMSYPRFNRSLLYTATFGLPPFTLLSDLYSGLKEIQTELFLVISFTIVAVVIIYWVIRRRKTSNRDKQ